MRFIIILIYGAISIGLGWILAVSDIPGLWSVIMLIYGFKLWFNGIYFGSPAFFDDEPNFKRRFELMMIPPSEYERDGRPLIFIGIVTMLYGIIALLFILK